jgi:hypothetical protein
MTKALTRQTAAVPVTNAADNIDISVVNADAVDRAAP